MPVANEESGTRIDEISEGIHRISTPIPPSDEFPPGFTFNQFLIADDEPLLFHTGLRKMFPLLRQATRSMTPLTAPPPFAPDERSVIPSLATSALPPTADVIKACCPTNRSLRLRSVGIGWRPPR